MNELAKIEPSTLALWNAVSKTDPRHTKAVNQRGGFTAIGAHSQILSATREFGPVGIGWGYANGEPIWHETLVFVPVTLWHGERGNEFGPLYGGAEWRSDKGRLDSDALKKAATDGLTKALSHLGFNADVFMGLFDDNKYVEQVRHEFEEEERQAAVEKLPGISGIKKRLHPLMIEGNADTDLATFNERVSGHKDDLASIRDHPHEYWTGDGGDWEGFRSWIKRRREELAPHEDSLAFQLLASTLAEVETKMALQSWLRKNGDQVETLDGEESRRFEELYSTRETAIAAMDSVSV